MFAAAQCNVFINIAEKWHIVKPGTAEQGKTECPNTKSGTVKPRYEYQIWVKLYRGLVSHE